MHYNLVKAKLYFDVNLDIEGMDKLVHPYKGYFSYLEHKLYTQEDLIGIYKMLLLAKHERNLGQTLLADELTALSLWLQVDTDRKGVITIEQFKNLMTSY